MTMTFIASTTLGSNTSSLSFSNIPQTFAHLQIRLFGKTQSNGAISLFFNGVSSGTSYTFHYLQGDGSAVASAGFASQPYMSNLINNINATYWACHIYDLLDYANTNKNKTIRGINGWDGNGSGYAQLFSGLYVNTSAITQVDLFNGYVWTAGTRADLYGITTSEVTGA